MSTNTFAYSLEDLSALEYTHAVETFMKSDEKELLYVDEADDTGEDRTVFGWGPCCPIELNDGVRMCKSFKVKHNCCQSVVCESMARNYLAKHLFDSSNHPTHLDKAASFQAANNAPIVMTTETKDDRRSYRNHCNFFAERNKAAAEERKQNRDRHGAHRSRSPRVAKGSKGGGTQKGESGVAIGALPASSSRSSALSTAVDDDRAVVVRKSTSVRAQLDELQTLEACLGRAIESQKRTIESLNFFSRMIQDERAVFTEARNVIAELIFKAKLGRTSA